MDPNSTNSLLQDFYRDQKKERKREQAARLGLALVLVLLMAALTGGIYCLALMLTALAPK